jgi:hypothetical protein
LREIAAACHIAMYRDKNVLRHVHWGSMSASGELALKSGEHTLKILSYLDVCLTARYKINLIMKTKTEYFHLASQFIKFGENKGPTNFSYFHEKEKHYLLLNRSTVDT